MSEHFDADHIHTTPEGRHFRHGDGMEVDGDGSPLDAKETTMAKETRTPEQLVEDARRIGFAETSLLMRALGLRRPGESDEQFACRFRSMPAVWHLRQAEADMAR
jgi:hypothetical protein